jgi:hypothetical protein
MALSSPSAGEAPEAPAFLIKILHARTVEEKAEKQSTTDKVAGSKDKAGGDKIQKGKRQQSCFDEACAYRNAGLDYEGILFSLRRFNKDRCSPSLDDAQIKDIAERVGNYEVNKPTPEQKHTYGELIRAATELFRESGSYDEASAQIREQNDAKPENVRVDEKALLSLLSKAEEEAAKTDWRTGLLRGPKGVVKANVANVAHILKHHPDWDSLRYDAFRDNIITTKAPPWGGDPIGKWSDVHDILTVEWFQREIKLDVSVNTVNQGMQAAARADTFDPLKDY